LPFGDKTLVLKKYRKQAEENTVQVSLAMAEVGGGGIKITKEKMAKVCG